MRIIGWCTTLGLGLVGVFAIGATGCTATVNGGTDGGTVFPDDAEADADAAAPLDSGTPPPDSGDAGGCGVAPDTSNPTCDTCLETMCCTQLETCFGTNPSASTMCEALVSCVQDAEAGNDAAAPMTMSNAFDLCAPDGGTTYTATDLASAAAFLSCLGDGNASGACASSCPQQ